MYLYKIVGLSFVKKNNMFDEFYFLVRYKKL